METPYEYYNKQLGVKMRFLISDRNKHEQSLCIYSYSALNKRLNNPNVCPKQLRKACFGHDALVLFNSLERETKDLLIFKFGKPQDEVKKSQFAQNYMFDHRAYNFFLAHTYGDDHKKLDLKFVEIYTNNASVLNNVMTMKLNRKEYARSLGVNTIDMWQSLSNDVNAFREVEHNLPTTKDGLRRKTNEYVNQGYAALISDKFGMQNALIVTDKIESLIISLYCLPNKPYVEAVHVMYGEFLRAEIEVVNIKTGEIFERKNFYKNNKPVEISLATVWNIVNAPHNALVIAKARNGAYDFNHKMRPHVNRTPPVFAMSKISLDDRDIMHTKLHDGSKVMAYYAFDVMSGAMIGIAHSKSKNHELYLDCIRNMFQFTTSRGLGIPMQMEVEQHLVSDFKDGLMKAGNLFPMVRWCNATNSQEKRAEGFIGNKKYGVEKNNNQNVGRHYSRLESNRVTLQKIFDEHNDNYKDAKATFEQIVANELQEQVQYNNQLHSNQSKYKGQTRLQVFLNNINPDLTRLDNAILYKYIGNKTETSIRRSQYVVVQYAKFQLSSPAILRKLQPNNYNVDAFYLKNEKHEIESVYIYQNGNFIDECKPVPTFNTANSEWTDADVLGFENATKFISEFDAMVRNDTAETLQKVTITRTNNNFVDITPQVVEDLELEPVFEYETINIKSIQSQAINDL
jgi:hypothetical protein